VYVLAHGVSAKMKLIAHLQLQISVPRNRLGW
jgi:hypothetical protein